MPQFPDVGKVVFFDLETGGLAKNRAFHFTIPEFQKWSHSSGTTFASHAYAGLHANYPILQLHATHLPYFNPIKDTTGTFLRRGDIPPQSLIQAPTDSRLQISQWARDHGLLEMSAGATQTEEQALRGFYEGIEQKIAREGQVALGGWNVGFDLTAVESAARRYDSLSQYHGFLGRQIEANALQVVEGSELFAGVVLDHAAKNPAWAAERLRMAPSGKIATTEAELKHVPGWRLEDVLWGLGGPENVTGIAQEAQQLHVAAFDTEATARAYQRLNIIRGAQESGDFSTQVAAETEELLGRVFRDTAWSRRVEELIAAGERMGPKGAPVLEAVVKPSYKGLAIAGLTLAGTAIAAGLAFGKRRDRQTQITGLSDEGLAARKRHELTSFGSGWKGLGDDDPVLNWTRVGTAVGLYGGYRLANRYRPEQTGRAIRKAEEWFPNKYLNFFGWSQLQAGYTRQELNWGLGQIVDHGGVLTQSGEHMQRLFGEGIDLAEHARQQKGLRFTRASAWKPYYQLEGTDYFMRFAGSLPDEKRPGLSSGSRWVGASYRYNAPLGQTSRVPREISGGSWRAQWKGAWRQRVASMTPETIRPGLEADGLIFQPLFAYKAGEELQGLRQKAGIIALEMVEQPQKMFARFGFGLKAGTWNSAGGWVKGMLLKRALPVAAGFLALDYADYLTGRRVSTGILGIGPKANVLRAELTDKIPGARATTDWYERHVPGPQIGPVALPAAGLALGGVAAWAARLAGNETPHLGKKWGLAGVIAGAVLAAPFVPGMLGSRKTADELRAIYSGDEPVPVRSGRWWDLSNTPWEGGRIKMYRPHWYARLQARPERTATWGSEEEYWEHNPVLHPIKWLKDPYYLEEKHYQDRPYPMASPVGSNIPLIGPLVAATVGRVLKPPKRMHEAEWDGTDYTLFSTRMEPRGPDALPAPAPRQEFSSLGELARRQGEITAEFLGLSGFIGKTFWNKFHPDHEWGRQVYFEGSRQMTSLSRRYYEAEIGAAVLPTPELDDYTGYSEALRRFIQKDLKTLQANEIPNQMPSWLPGNDYFLDFKHGDPYTKVPSGTSRLPGAGYAALHPELEGVAPQDYPLLTRFEILSDVAPWSAQWFQHKAMADSDTQGDTEARIQYEQILARAEAMKESSETFDERRFTGETEKMTGVVKRVSGRSIELDNGRRVKLSAVGTNAADLSAVVLGQNNELTRGQVAREVENRQNRLNEYLSGLLRPGTEIEMVVPKGTAGHAPESQAVVFVGGRNVNRELIDEGLAREREDEAGPEFQAMTSAAGRAIGKLAETAPRALFQTPVMPGVQSLTKLWDQRDAFERYKYQELYGNRMQRWETPVKSYMMPWFRELSYDLTGRVIMPKYVQQRRDYNTLADQLEYLRSLNSDTNNRSRTAIGSNVLADPGYIRSTLSGRDKYYFNAFLREADPEKRHAILDAVPEDFGRILQGQWVRQDLALAEEEGQPVPEVAEGGRLLEKEAVEDYERAQQGGETKLNFGDWERSREVANFFFRRNIRLPESPDSPVYNENIDYEDVKAKIIDEEGLEMHDYEIFDDRAALLWRKPYVDGAVAELTSGNDKTVEQLRQAVEEMILASRDKEPDVRITSQASKRERTNLTIRIEEQPDKEILRDIRRHRDEYQKAS